MRCTYRELERLGRSLGVLLLAVHAVAAGWLATRLLALPIEAGGLFFGPFLGLPLLAVALSFAAGAVLLALRGEPRYVPYLGLVFAVLTDVWLLAGAGA